MGGASEEAVARCTLCNICALLLFFFREAMPADWHHVAKLVLRWRPCSRAMKYWRTIRLRDKCAPRPWQRRWLSLSAHFNQPLLLSRGRSLQIRLQRSRSIGFSLCSKAGAIFSLQEAMLCSTCTLALHVVMRAIAQNSEAFRCGQSEWRITSASTLWNASALTSMLEAMPYLTCKLTPYVVREIVKLADATFAERLWRWSLW